MQAAKSGQLNTQAGLEQQVNRMLRSPRVADGIRALLRRHAGVQRF